MRLDISDDYLRSLCDAAPDTPLNDAVLQYLYGSMKHVAQNEMALGHYLLRELLRKLREEAVKSV